MPTDEQIQAEYQKIKNSRRAWSELGPDDTAKQEALLQRQAKLEATLAAHEPFFAGEAAELEELRKRS